MDWTQVTLTIGPAIVTAVAGYALARLNAQAEIRRVEAENERLVLQHREDHLRNRQSTYHLFLNLDRRLLDVMWDGLHGDEWPKERVDPVREQWANAANGVMIFGTEAAREAIVEYRDLLQRRTSKVYEPRPGVYQRMFEVTQGDDILAARRKLVDAMRADVAKSV